MSNPSSSSNFDPTPGSNLNHGLPITASTRTLSLTSTNANQQHHIEETEAIEGATADIQVQCNHTTSNPGREYAIGEGLSYSNEACESSAMASAVELRDELYTTTEMAGNEGSSDDAGSTDTVLATGYDGPSAITLVNHTTQSADAGNGDLSTGPGTAQGESLDDNTDHGFLETHQRPNKTGQDDTADETAQEDAPHDVHTNRLRAIQERIADSSIFDIAQDGSRNHEGSRKAKKDAIEGEVRKEFRPKMEMLQREMEELGEKIATEIDNRQRVLQEIYTQDNESHEDGIAEEVEKQFRRERESLQDEIDDLVEAFAVELSTRLYDFDVSYCQKEESQEDDTQEASTEACVSQTSDATYTENNVEEDNGKVEGGLGEVGLVFEDDIDETDGDGTITDERKAEDEEIGNHLTEHPSFQPLEKQSTGDTAPTSSYEDSSETDPIGCVGQMITTMEPGNSADQTIPQQASAQAKNPKTLSNDNTNANMQSDEPSNDADSENSRLNNRNDRADHDISDHDSPEAHTSIGPSSQQKGSPESEKAESQVKAAGALDTTEQPKKARTTSRPEGNNTAQRTERPYSTSSSEELSVAREADATNDTAPAGRKYDSAPTSTAPINNDSTSTLPASTTSANNVSTAQASRRRIRHYARKAKAKMYGIRQDNGKK